MVWPIDAQKGRFPSKFAHSPFLNSCSEGPDLSPAEPEAHIVPYTQNNQVVCGQPLLCTHLCEPPVGAACAALLAVGYPLRAAKPPLTIVLSLRPSAQYSSIKEAWECVGAAFEAKQ